MVKFLMQFREPQKKGPLSLRPIFCPSHNVDYLRNILNYIIYYSLQWLYEEFAWMFHHQGTPAGTYWACFGSHLLDVYYYSHEYKNVIEQHLTSL